MGEKRIGIAMGEETMGIATPHAVLTGQDERGIVQALIRILEEYRIEKIVVGLPKTLKGEMGPAAKKVVAQIERLKAAIGREWVFWDERLTTAEVDRVLRNAEVHYKKRKEVRDSLAAQRILQGYFDCQRNTMKGADGLSL